MDKFSHKFVENSHNWYEHSKTSYILIQNIPIYVVQSLSVADVAIK